MCNKAIKKLESNLYRINTRNSSYKLKLKLLTLNHGTHKQWLKENLLPNTRLIIEPKIAGLPAVLFYKEGILRNIIIQESIFNANDFKRIKIIPNKLAIDKDIAIRGNLYNPKLKLQINSTIKPQRSQELLQLENLSFCPYQICNSNQNQYQVLLGLKQLGFEIPETHFTIFINQVDLYVNLWKEGKLFESYPANGIVLKVNSRKLQKQLGENSLCPNWAFSIEC